MKDNGFTWNRGNITQLSVQVFQFNRVVLIPEINIACVQGPVFEYFPGHSKIHGSHFFFICVVLVYLCSILFVSHIKYVLPVKLLQIFF